LGWDGNSEPGDEHNPA